MPPERRKRSRDDDRNGRRDEQPTLPGLDKLPQSRDAERAVLGSMLRDNGVIDDLVQLVRAESFYLDAHQKIFQAIVELYNGGSGVDLVTLGEEILRRGQLEDIGGPGYLGELWTAAPTAANAEYYGKIVRDRAVVRSLIHAGNEILRDAYDQTASADELVEGAEKKILEVSDLGLTGQTFTLDDALKEAYDRIDARQQGVDASSAGLPTGFADLDELTAGLQNSELIIIAARPSVGKTAFALNIVRHIIAEGGRAAFFVSLEQARIELAERLLCSQARVDSHRLRKGTLSGDDMQKLIEAGGMLRLARLYIDDSPGQTMLRIAANARRLKKRQDIRIVVIDYLQLIEPENRRDPRQEQVAQISRRLKGLARELKIPVVALAQVNRAAEDRQDHRPRVSDLRESGCLTGDTLVTLADSGRRVPIRDLVGQAGFQVWALDEQTLKLRPAGVSNAFSTGHKPVFLLRTRLGREIRATSNHTFRGFRGWQRLDELRPGVRIALPRNIENSVPATCSADEVALLGHLIGDGCTLPRHAIQYTTREEDLAQLVATLAVRVFGSRVTPKIKRERDWFQVYLAATERLTHGRRNPVAEWLTGLGVFGLRSYEKRVPESLFEQPADVVAGFLRHLWATDGCIRPPKNRTRHPAVYYASSSKRLALDVQELLLRLGINAVCRERSQGSKGRPQFHVLVMGHGDLLSFADRIGAVGLYKLESLNACRVWLLGRKSNTNCDVIPAEVWHDLAVPAMRRNRVTMRAMQHALGMQFMGSGLYKQNVSRERIGRVADAVGGDPTLAALASSDIYWDEILSITPDGEEEVYDLTVPGPANFVANGIVVHNSIEQDADTIFLLHRPERYEPGQHEGIVEVIVGKQRNGPVGEVTLSYVKQYMRYENYRVGNPFDS